MAPKVLPPLIPYDSPRDLWQRVTSLFQWYQPGDPLPPQKSIDPKFPQGTLVPYPKDDFTFTYYPKKEFDVLLRYLPETHEIFRTIMEQTRLHLLDIQTKKQEELEQHNPEYMNAFMIMGSGYEQLFFPILAAAYHILERPLLLPDDPPREHPLVALAVGSMHNYWSRHSTQVLTFYDYAYEKKRALAHTLQGCIAMGEASVIGKYIELFTIAQGNDTFLLDNIARDINFNLIGKTLYMRFRDYDFKGLVQATKDRTLQRKLEKIFGE